MAALVALIIINSVVFSVRSVTANSLNTSTGDCPVTRDMNSLIEEHHGIRIGSSIFMLNEDSATARVTQNIIAQQDSLILEIRALERIFPNRVVVHYVLLLPYFYVQVGSSVKSFANNGILMHIDTNPTAARARGAIGLIVRGELESLAIGEQFATTVDADTTRFFAAVHALEHLTYHHLFRNEFRYIDISNPQAIFVQTAAGAVFDIRSVANFTEHFRHALSTFRDFFYNDTVEYRARALRGTLRVIQDAAGVISVVYSE